MRRWPRRNTRSGSPSRAAHLPHALVLGDGLGAQQQQGRRDLEAEHDHDGRGHGAVDHVHLRHGREIPDQHVARQFPQQGRGDAADQGMPDRQAAHRHHQIDRGQHQDLARQPEQVEQRPRHPAQRPFVAEQPDALGAHHLQGARHQRYDHDAEAQRHDVAVGQHRRHQEVAPPHRETVHEDHAHGVFEHREGQRTEEQHGERQHPGDDGPVVEEVRDLGDDRARLARRQQLEIAAQGVQQFGLVDEVRQHHHDQHQEGHDGQQRVVGDGAGQQQALVGAEALEDLEGEGQRMRQDVAVGAVIEQARAPVSRADHRASLIPVNCQRAPAGKKLR